MNQMKIIKSFIILAFVIALISCGKNENAKNPQKAGETKGTNSSYITQGANAGSKIQLKLNLEKGSRYNLKMLTEQSITQTIQKQKVSSIQSIGVSYTYNVENVESDGTQKIKVIYNSFLQDIQSGNNRMSYNSANPKDKDNPFAKIYSSLIDKGFTMIISPEGDIKSLTGVDALLKSVIKKMELPSEELRAAAEQSLSEQFSDKAVKESMQSMMGIYPHYPVGIGDSWSKSSVIKKTFPANYDTKWTLKEIKGGIAFVSVQSKIKGLPKTENDGKLAPKYNISGEQSGMIEVDIKSGWLLKAKMIQKFSGKIELEKSQVNSEAISVPITIEGSITMEAVK